MSIAYPCFIPILLLSHSHPSSLSFPSSFSLIPILLHSHSHPPSLLLPSSFSLIPILLLSYSHPPSLLFPSSFSLIPIILLSDSHPHLEADESCTAFISAIIRKGAERYRGIFLAHHDIPIGHSSVCIDAGTRTRRNVVISFFLIGIVSVIRTASFLHLSILRGRVMI